MAFSSLCEALPKSCEPRSLQDFEADSSLEQVDSMLARASDDGLGSEKDSKRALSRQRPLMAAHGVSESRCADDGRSRDACATEALGSPSDAPKPRSSPPEPPRARRRMPRAFVNLGELHGLSPESLSCLDIGMEGDFAFSRRDVSPQPWETKTPWHFIAAEDQFPHVCLKRLEWTPRNISDEALFAAEDKLPHVCFKRVEWATRNISDEGGEVPFKCLSEVDSA